MHTVKIGCLGYSIIADWYEGTAHDEVILFLMGSMSTRKRQVALVSTIVQDTGRSALVIDYSGHGESPFALSDITPAQHVVETVYAYDWIRNRYPDAKISVISSSYGSYLAAHLIIYRWVEQLVLRAPAIYQPRTLYDSWGIRLKDEAAYRTAIGAYRKDTFELRLHPILQNAKQFNGKTLVMVHSNDEVIPAEVTDAYTEAFNAIVYIAQDVMHALSHSSLSEAAMKIYTDAMSQWLNTSKT
jgi:pimeloyl-ACP methyl ester carboxylesterase